MNTIQKYARLVKFSHTIFAMPFAMLSFTYALWSNPTPSDSTSWWIKLLVQVVLCMVFARNVAMGFNRWADRDIDARNPRTADREIPAGIVKPRAAMTFVIINALLFILVAATINPLTAWLSPIALAVVMAYSLCKRFTSLAHLVLGLALGIAPVGAYIAVRGAFSLEACILSLVVLTWTGGFDIIYALQDADFDRQEGLHSIPARFSPRSSLGISIALHVVSVAALVWFATFLPSSVWTWAGVSIFAAILTLEHILVTPTRTRHIGIAFGTLNGLASLTLAVLLIVGLLLA
jgi:4-hydroxybenzoate polyprenyltransferase